MHCQVFVCVHACGADRASVPQRAGSDRCITARARARFRDIASLRPGNLDAVESARCHPVKIAIARGKITPAGYLLRRAPLEVAAHPTLPPRAAVPACRGPVDAADDLWYNIPMIVAACKCGAFTAVSSVVCNNLSQVLRSEWASDTDRSMAPPGACAARAVLIVSLSTVPYMETRVASMRCNDHLRCLMHTKH